MKAKRGSLCITMLLVVSLAAHASETEQSKAKTDSAEFARMKALLGTCAGKADMGQGPIDMTIQYRLLASGRVLEERCFVGTPNEMVTMYYDQNG